jgi:hypothetical protein
MSTGRIEALGSPSSQEEQTMRSELVFKALAYESNRYQLVRLLAKGTRSLHRPATRVQDTTNEILERFSESASTAETPTFEQTPFHGRRAA